MYDCISMNVIVDTSNTLTIGNQLTIVDSYNEGIAVTTELDPGNEISKDSNYGWKEVDGAGDAQCKNGSQAGTVTCTKIPFRAYRNFIS